MKTNEKSASERARDYGFNGSFDAEQTKIIMPLLNEITSMAFLLNASGKFTIWIDYQGHVRSLTVRGHLGHWYLNKEENFRLSTYLDFSSGGAIEETTSNLRWILRELDMLMSGTFKIGSAK